jgi:ketosteroid isomerase-like protein
VHRTQTPGEAILEYSGAGRIVRSGHPILQRYIAVIQTSAGKVTRWVDDLE